MSATLALVNAPTLPEVLESLDLLGHPLRARILLALRHGTASPNALRADVGASLGTVAYHVRILLAGGQIRLARETRVRGAVEHHYAITAAGWRAIAPLARLEDHHAPPA